MCSEQTVCMLYENVITFTKLNNNFAEATYFFHYL